MKSLVFYDSEGLKYIDIVSINSPELISSDQDMRMDDYLLNDDGTLLAFINEEALMVFDAKTGNIRILIEHTRPDLHTTDFNAADFRVYSPSQWSPENDWLIVEEGYFEGSSYKYLSSISGKLLSSSACLPQFSRLANSNSLVFSTAISDYGYYPCGQLGGIYLVEFNEVAVETHLYESQDDGELISSQIVYILSSTDGALIAFVEYINDSADTSWHFILAVINQDGTEIYSNQSSDKVTYLFPTWSSDNKELYFTEFFENKTTIIRLAIDSQSVTSIGTYMGEVCLFEPSPDSDWFLFGLRQPNETACNLTLLEIASGNLYPITQLEGVSTLGWETK